MTRKVCGGNHTWAGAATQEVLASVLATCRKQGHSPYEVLGDLYCAHKPMTIRFESASPLQLQPP